MATDEKLISRLPWEDIWASPPWLLCAYILPTRLNQIYTYDACLTAKDLVLAIRCKLRQLRDKQHEPVINSNVST